jgi:hypothetical protein
LELIEERIDNKRTMEYKARDIEKDRLQDIAEMEERFETIKNPDRAKQKSSQVAHHD